MATHFSDLRVLLAAPLVELALSETAIGNVLDTEPQTRNSPVVETPEAVKLEPFTGSAVYTYKFEVPPGTGGLTPDLRLSYSTLTRGTEYGWGWTLNLSRIERSTRFGPPTYIDGQDQFELDGELLVPDPGPETNRFHKQHIDFSRIRYVPGQSPESSYWEVTHTDGTRLLFGSRASAHSRLTIGPGLTGQVFRWSLDQVIDARGNSYIVEYECEPGGGISDTCTDDISYVYPKRIRYSFRPNETGSPTTPRSERLVVFSWDQRGYPLSDSTNEPFDRPTSYRSGYKIQIGRRLVAVAVGIDASNDGKVDPGEQVRRYALTYAPKTSLQDPNSPPFSELTSVQRYGSDDTPFPSADNPRPTTFTYSRPGRGFSTTSYSTPLPASGATGGVPEVLFPEGY